MGTTLTSLSCSGTLPVDYDRLKMSVNGFEIVDATFFDNQIPNPTVTWTFVLIKFTYYPNNFISNNWLHEQTFLSWIQKIFIVIFSRMFYV